jgi:DNA ligase-1
VLLADLAATSAAVTAAPARNDKTSLLAGLLAQLDADEVEAAVGFLIAVPRQGRIGVGWAAVSRLDVAAAAEPSITILELDDLLTELAATTGEGSTAARDQLLRTLMSRATDAEHVIVRQILTGELRQGALAGVVTAAVGRAAEVKMTTLRRAVMLIGNLGEAAHLALTGGDEALEKVALEVGRPIEPMLASISDSVADAIDSIGMASVEWKLDGVRIQVHRSGELVRIFTRNLNDITDRLPTVVAIAQSLPVSSVVLDGEVIGLIEDGSPRPFQDTMSDLGREEAIPEETIEDETTGDTDRRAMTPFFFDVMHLDGKTTIDLPLHERSALLDRIAAEHRIPSVQTDDHETAKAHSDAALAAGHEGVMVKGTNGLYEAGRRGKSWRKVKPVITLDLLVIGAEWGHGRRKGKLSNLHLGARIPETGEFVMVGKTFKGLTDELLAWQTERFLQLELESEDETVSDRGSGRDSRTVFIRPELVVEIAVDGVQRSTRYPGGVALRFARVKGYRPDRAPDSVESITRLRSLLPSSASGKTSGLADPTPPDITSVDVG